MRCCILLCFSHIHHTDMSTWARLTAHTLAIHHLEDDIFSFCASWLTGNILVTYIQDKIELPWFIQATWIYQYTNYDEFIGMTRKLFFDGFQQNEIYLFQNLSNRDNCLVGYCDECWTDIIWHRYVIGLFWAKLIKHILSSGTVTAIIVFVMQNFIATDSNKWHITAEYDASWNNCYITIIGNK